MSKTTEDFRPEPTYSQTKTANEAWINVTTTKTEADGTVTQVSAIIPKK